MIKIEVLGMERVGTVEVRFPVTVYKSADGTVWTQVVGSPSQVVLEAVEILAVTNNDGLTGQQKLQALMDLMKAQVEANGITDAEEAIDDLRALGIVYPATINL